MASSDTGYTAEAPPLELSPLRERTALVAFLAFLIFVLVGPITTAGAAMNSAQLSGEGNTTRQVVYFAIFVLSAFAVRPLAFPRRLFILPISIVVLLGWCWASMLWSVAPEITFRRIILTTIVIWTAFILTRSLSWPTLRAATIIVLVGALLANYLAVLAAPQIGIHQFDPLGDPGLVGDWRGIMPEKNATGALCALTIIFLFF